MREAAVKIQNAPLYIEDKGGITIEDLKTTARRHKRQYGIEFIAIDYLQLIRCFTKMAQSSKNAEVTEISAQIKALAKELDLPIVCLSQLNRAAGKGGRPRMADLRDSGSIEQDADIIGLLHRYDYEGVTDRKGEAEINITKNRNGPTGVVELEWHPEITQFTEKIITSEPSRS
jgi:replicative DNA helicase